MLCQHICVAVCVCLFGMIVDIASDIIIVCVCELLCCISVYIHSDIGFHSLSYHRTQSYSFHQRPVTITIYLFNHALLYQP